MYYECLNLLYDYLIEIFKKFSSVTLRENYK